MKNKGVVIMGGLVVLMAVYAYFGEYKREIKETETSAETSKIVSFKKDQIQKIEINKSGGIQILLERTVDGWNMLKPVQDEGDNEVIEAFLDQIAMEKSVDKIKLQVANLGQYGFTPSLGTVVLIKNNSERQQIEIGSKKNFEGSIFLRRDQENQILTSSETWMSFLTKPSDQFRNLRFYRGTISKVNRIKLQNKNGTFEIFSENAKWISKAHPDWNLDQNAVREILTQTTLAKGTEILKEAPQGSPILTIELGLDNETWKGSLYQDKKTKDVIGKFSSPEIILRFAPQALEELRHKDLLEFRDKLEPFHFQKVDIQKITVKTKLKSYSLLRKNSAWHLEKEDPELIVNSTMADALITKLSKLTVYRFFEDKKPATNLKSEVQLIDAAGKVIFSLAWGEFIDREGMAKTNLYGETFLMDDAQINQLMLPELVKAKPPSAKPVDPLHNFEQPQKEEHP